MDWSLAAPALLLALVAWAVPWTLSRVLPAGGRWIVANLAASTLLVGLAGAMIFAWLYGAAAEAVRAAAPGHFLLLSAKAALIWGPILVLTVTRRGA